MNIGEFIEYQRRAGHAVGDARKRLLEQDDLPNHDEQHAHLHEWPDYDDS